MGVEYRCDKCSRMNRDIERMSTIGIAVALKSTNTASSRVIKPQLWCEICLGDVGIHMSTYQVVVEQKASLEDLLRKLITDEIENSKGN